MITSHYSYEDSESRHAETLVSELEQAKQMKHAVSEVYSLLEQYAPSWYPERLRKKLRRFCDGARVKRT